jgi:predicted Zn-dependent protease with MMP-like domain
MNRKSFEKHVETAIGRIPSKLRGAMENIAIIIRDRPGPEAEGLEEGPEGEDEGGLYGLYHGIPLPERTVDDSGTEPDVIYIYREPLEADFPDPSDLIREIEITVVHEIAHYFGLGEDTLAEYGYD